ncbi:MAG: CBS domain-containing protein [Candidatus Tectomicrobia bacterium]|nr:CBS domain-containing protein [Candidatus Tectomicrobia bacterium]
MQQTPTLKTLMTPFPHAIEINTPLSQAQEMMATHDIRHLPVIDGHQLVGVISERDLHRSLHERSIDSPQRTFSVGDVSISKAYVVELSERLDTVLLEMAKQHIGSALVVRRGKLAVIFTATDACRSFGDYLRTQFPPSDEDGVA